MTMLRLLPPSLSALALALALTLAFAFAFPFGSGAALKQKAISYKTNLPSQAEGPAPTFKRHLGVYSVKSEVMTQSHRNNATQNS